MSPVALPEGWERWQPDQKAALRRQLHQAHLFDRYGAEPAAFVRDAFDWSAIADPGPTPYQEEILGNLVEHGREAARGPHGLGKTALAAWVILWFAITRDGLYDWKAPTTASVWRQLREFLWPEVHKWARLLRWPAIGRAPFDEPRELQDMALRLDTGSAFAVASDQPSAIEGAHADSILYIYDEAKSIPAATFDASEGAFSGAGADTAREAFALALSTPGPPKGRFYDICRRDPRFQAWHPRHVTLEEAIAAGRISQGWVADKERAWGPSSSLFLNRVRGEFAADDEAGVIPLSWVEQAVARWEALAVTDLADRSRRVPDMPLEAIGADIADQGADETVLALRSGEVLLEVRGLPFSPDPMESAGQIVALVRGRGGFVVVDSIGVGSGVVARLREVSVDGAPIQVVAFNAATRSDATDTSGELEFANLRAEAWWGMRERLDPGQGSQVALPPDDDLIADLTTPKWKLTSAGKVLIESKDDLRKPDRLGRSPDRGDAVVMAYWGRRPRSSHATPADYGEFRVT